MGPIEKVMRMRTLVQDAILAALKPRVGLKVIEIARRQDVHRHLGPSSCSSSRVAPSDRTRILEIPMETYRTEIRGPHPDSSPTCARRIAKGEGHW